jgi:hypothetical protein
MAAITAGETKFSLAMSSRPVRCRSTSLSMRRATSGSESARAPSGIPVFATAPGRSEAVWVCAIT